MTDNEFKAELADKFRHHWSWIKKEISDEEIHRRYGNTLAYQVLALKIRFKDLLLEFAKAMPWNDLLAQELDRYKRLYRTEEASNVNLRKRIATLKGHLDRIKREDAGK